jgi:hypothetical protein
MKLPFPITDAGPPSVAGYNPESFPGIGYKGGNIKDE